MTTVSIVSLLVVLLILADCVVRKSDPFSPVRLYVFFHALTLGIAFLALDKAMTPFHPLTSVVYFGSGFCFVLGAFLARLLENPVRGYKAFSWSKPYNWTLHLSLAFILFVIFIGGIFVATTGLGTLPLLAANKGKALYVFFRVSWFSSVFLSFGGIVMALFFMTIFRHPRRNAFLNVGIWMTVISLVVFVLVLSRSGIMFFAFFAMVFYHYGVRRLSVGKLSLLFTLILSVFLVTTYLKVNELRKTHQISMSTETIFSHLLKVPYLYVANNFWNLDYALNPENHEQRHPTTYGFTSISGLLDMMRIPGGTLGGAIRAATDYDDQFHERSIKVKGLNTIGYQWGLYKDFGIPGALGIPFLFGFLFALLYRRMLRAPTMLNLATYSYLAFFVGLSWFLAFWESMIYLYGFFYILACCGLSQIGGREPPSGDVSPRT